MILVFQQVDISTLIPAFSKVTDLNSIVNQASYVCLEDLQSIAFSTRVKTATNGVGLIII